ncbi:MAG: FtsX-like permease family protein [Spirochaetaceae bacterium]|jgi:ABC-type lipoprotein release transport system permease subunit|nr:FtsX-like permease family protein [Spirochaetaceae bacterium]
MKFASIFPLALKYLLRYRRRYLFLATALSIGFGIVTVIITQKDGMIENVYNSAQSHYAGDIVLEGRDMDSGRKNHMDFGTVSAIVKAIDDSGIRYTGIVKRTLLMSYERIYFNGNALDLKYTVGIDWDNERDYLASLNWRDGVYDAPSDDTIYISAPIAARLGAVRGDSLIMEVLTRDEQKNTGNFVIGGIIEDYSLFGFYKVYVSRRTLNRLAQFDEEDASHVGVFVPPNNRDDGAREAIYEELKQWIDVSPPPADRDEWDEMKDEDWSGIRVFLLNMAVYLSEVSQILEALNLLTYFLYAIMLLIILVSAIVTYRLILHERTRELGTMRAIGFKGRDIRLVLILETLMLGTVSIVAGLVLSLIINGAFSQVSFTWIPSFEIFMKNGRLAAKYSAASLALNSLAVYSILIVAVWFPALATSRRNLPEMLAAGAKG